MNKSIETIQDYGTHQATVKWAKTNYYCPNCGTKDKVYENNHFDYFVSNDNLCLNCGFIFNMPISEIVNGVDKQSLEQLIKTLGIGGRINE